MPFYTMEDQSKLHVREIGQGKPVLILSGLGMSSWQWLPFIYSNLGNRRFYIPDYRGFGASKHCKIPKNISAIENHWQDIQCLLKQWNIQKFDVIAYSMGATTTMHGLKYGNFAQHIDHYLQIDQTAKIRNSNDWSYGLFGQQQLQFLNLIEQIIQLLTPYQHLIWIKKLPKDAQSQLTSLWSDFMYLQKNQPHPWLEKITQTQIFQKLQPRLLPLQRLDYIIWYLTTYFEHDEDYRAALAALDRPTEFIIGRQSTLYNYQGQLAIANQLEQAEVRMMEKSGHVPLMNEPFKFRQTLNRFLEKSASSKS